MFRNYKNDSKEAWIRRLNLYWNSTYHPQFITRVGEIYEIDFGENPGTEFSGRHLGVCLSDTPPSQEKMLVIPLTTKFKQYNISKEDIIETKALHVSQKIVAGIVLGEAKWISKHRIFKISKILQEPETIKNPVKGYIEVSKCNLKKWRTL